jgi:hypothetical protein
MAPLGSNPLSYNNVVKMMMVERKIQDAQSRDVFEKTLKDATTSTDNYRCNAFVRDVNGVEWLFNDKPYDNEPYLKAFSGKFCDEITETMKAEYRKTFNDYLEGVIDIKHDYPTSTGPIRTVYSALRKYDGCFSRKDKMPNPGDAMLLNFFNNVKVNIAGGFADRIEEADRLLRSKGQEHLAGKLTVSNIKNMSRKEILDYISNLGTITNSKSTFSFLERRKIKKYQSFLNDTFKHFEDIPPSWYDSNAYLR